MLPSLHQQKLKAWVEILRDFQGQLESIGSNSLENSGQWRRIQTRFQEEILSLNSEGREGFPLSQWQSFQTETHRYLRLVQTDLLFFASSKGEQTKRERLLTIHNRLQAMILLGKKAIARGSPFSD